MVGGCRTGCGSESSRCCRRRCFTPTKRRPQGLCLDRGYDYEDARLAASDRGLTPPVRTRGEEIKLKAHTPGWRARRWVVEACHSWINRNRGLLIRWSKKDENSDRGPAAVGSSR
jgi:hypothetical protein